MIKYHKNPNSPLFYRYEQNCLGGQYETDDEVCRVVIIEAPDSDTANALAERYGLYFDSYRGNDCHCCGYRWRMAENEDGDTKPSEREDEDGFVKPLDDEVEFPDELKSGEVYIRVYYLNGNVDEYIKD